MKYLTLGLVVVIFTAGINTTALTNETEQATQNSTDLDVDQSMRDQEFINAKSQDALTDVYEYEEASLKILKYFGLPVMAGMIAALGCFVLAAQD